MSGQPAPLAERIAATGEGHGQGFDDAQLLRYSRHILLPEFGVEAQTRLHRSRVLLIGVGGLGSPAAMYLAAAGVGELVIADGDVVDRTNLQRQIAHAECAIGMPKTASAARTLAGLNADVRIVAIPERLQGAHLRAQVAAADVVLDCTDNFATRHAINDACVSARRPLVSGAAIRFDGQVAVFDPRRPDSPCYNCLFPEEGEIEDVPCALMGVFAPLTGIIGCVQAAEALKLVAGIGESLAGRLLLLDALSMTWRSLTLPRDPACRVCAEARLGAA